MLILLPTVLLLAAPRVEVGTVAGHDVAIEALGVLQVDARAALHDDDRHVEGHDGFAVPRARFGTRLFAGPLQLQLLFEGARERAGLLEAWALAEVMPGVNVSAGLARSPLFLYGPPVLAFRAQSERGILERALWPNRELGAGVHLRRADLPIEVWARITNGLDGAILGNDNQGLAAEARVDVLPFGDMLRIGAGARVEDTDNEVGVAGVTPTKFMYWRPPAVSGMSSRAVAHAELVLDHVRASAQGVVAAESRAVDDDGNIDTPKVPRPGVVHGGVGGEVTVTFGTPRVGQAPPAVAFGELPVPELSLRAERLWLGHPRFGEAVPDPTVTPGGALASSLVLAVWLDQTVSLSGQGHVVVYDVGPLETPDRTLSLTLLVRLNVIFM